MLVWDAKVSLVVNFATESCINVLCTILITAPCVTGQLQLAGGNIPNEGRVEICIRDNVWGTVCDDSWGSDDATVVCRQLGYSTQGIEEQLVCGKGIE